MGTETASGHSALWISGGGLQSGVVFNWGAYDGSKPTWWWHFVKGDLDFWATDEPISMAYKRSRARDRKLVAQRLDVPPADIEALTTELARLTLPENRHYRYNWFTDSCATKTRDAIDRLLGGALQEATRGIADNTRRDDMLRHMDLYHPAWLGLNFLLSAYHDQPISRWESMFDPEHLILEVSALDIQKAGGKGPLVTETCVLRDSDWPATPPKPPDRRALLWAVGAALAALLYALGEGGRKVVTLRWLSGLLVSAWGLFAGGLGTVVALIWLRTSLEGLGPTESWFQANPLTLGLIPAGIWMARGRADQAPWTRWLARLLTLLGTVGLFLDPLPFMQQKNLDLIGLFLPPLVAITALLRPRAAMLPGTGVAGDEAAR